MTENKLFNTDFLRRLAEDFKAQGREFDALQLVSGADDIDRQTREAEQQARYLERVQSNLDRARGKLDAISDALQDHIEAVIDEKVESLLDDFRSDFDLGDYQTTLEGIIDERLDERLEGITLRVET